jgi:hypothetical protein
MEGDLGPTIWIVLLLIVLLFVTLWGILALFLTVGTWFIVRARLPDNDAQPDPNADWQEDDLAPPRR